jgi:hypothetical protein
MSTQHYNLLIHTTLDVFGVCMGGYEEEQKGQVSKSLAVHALQSCKLACTNSFANQWNAENLGLPYSIRYPPIISIIY